MKLLNNIMVVLFVFLGSFAANAEQQNSKNFLTYDENWNLQQQFYAVDFLYQASIAEVNSKLKGKVIEYDHDVVLSNIFLEKNYTVAELVEISDSLLFSAKALNQVLYFESMGYSRIKAQRDAGKLGMSDAWMALANFPDAGVDESDYFSITRSLININKAIDAKTGNCFYCNFAGAYDQAASIVAKKLSSSPLKGLEDKHTAFDLLYYGVGGLIKSENVKSHKTFALAWGVYSLTLDFNKAESNASPKILKAHSQASEYIDAYYNVQ
ncbi:MAG: hypothetical protein CFH44_00402 [Proteobacteria bacterium]|nr:MAG: hypothetical protein CFH44_00402 [Pseudomonadota bacterium]|tara:strand:+ start:407 stop:1210 length:804 start_codon:yes stop_codon:yes gene_type:complete